jgi:hypothetical protein
MLTNEILRMSKRSAPPSAEGGRLLVRLVDFQRLWQEIEADALETFPTIGASGWYVLGPGVSTFESALAAAWGLSHATGLDLEAGAAALARDQVRLEGPGLGLSPADARIPRSPCRAALTIARPIDSRVLREPL